MEFLPLGYLSSIPGLITCMAYKVAGVPYLMASQWLDSAENTKQK